MVNDDHRLEQRVIEPIRTDERFLYVARGIKHGEIISITPLENPLPGTEVRFEMPQAAAIIGDQ